MSFSIYAIIPFLTLLQGIIFSILLILRGRREERYSDYWLAFVLFLLAVNGIPYMFGWLGIVFLWEKWTYLPWDGFWLAIPPATYFFLKSLTNDSWRFSFRQHIYYFWAYGLYFLEHTIIGMWGLFDSSIFKVWGQSSYWIIYSWLLDWGTDIYFFLLSYRLYRDYRTWAVNQFSDVDRVSFVWLRNFLIVKIILTVIAAANNIYVRFSPEHGDKFYALMWLAYLTDTVLMYYLSIAGYTQAPVRSIRFVEKPLDNLYDLVQSGDSNANEMISDIPESTSPHATKIKSSLTDDEMLAWKTKILKFFDAQKPYLDPELTLSDLADKLKTNTSVLSQVINLVFEKNFNDFVNQYRVNDFISKIATPQYSHLTLLAIAFECGFNSKSTFNRAVKKATNKMPSELIKEQSFK